MIFDNLDKLPFENHLGQNRKALLEASGLGPTTVCHKVKVELMLVTMAEMERE